MAAKYSNPDDLEVLIDEDAVRPVDTPMMWTL
jgi:hypothetical protein